MAILAAEVEPKYARSYVLHATVVFFDEHGTRLYSSRTRREKSEEGGIWDIRTVLKCVDSACIFKQG